jgi:DNA-binding NarL/FixJ family response regulator
VTLVYLADDDAEVRRALRLLVEKKLGLSVAGEAAHTHGLIPLVESAEADLLLLDWELPDRVDARLIAALHQLRRSLRIVIVSSRPDVREAALAAGADAFADKCEAPEHLLAIVKTQLPG